MSDHPNVAVGGVEEGEVRALPRCMHGCSGSVLSVVSVQRAKSGSRLLKCDRRLNLFRERTLAPCSAFPWSSESRGEPWGGHRVVVPGLDVIRGSCRPKKGHRQSD